MVTNKLESNFKRLYSKFDQTVEIVNEQRTFIIFELKVTSANKIGSKGI